MKILNKKSLLDFQTHANRTAVLARVLTLVIILTALSFSSCRKKEEEPQEQEDTEQSTATDNNLAESYAADIESMGSQISEGGSLSTFRESGASAMEASTCATISTVGQVTTIDFGTTGCVGSDGRVRKGKLIYDFSGSAASAQYYRHPGFKLSVSSQNYVVDNHTVTLVNKTISNTTPAGISTSVNPGINLTWSVTANISIVKPSNAGSINWTCTRTKELVNTSDTNCYKGQNRAIEWRKAIVKLNGSAGGVNARGENYSALATNLLRDFNCAPDPNRPHRHPFISGTIVYTPGGRLQRTIDYGNGACDMNAVLTIKNRVFNIQLP